MSEIKSTGYNSISNTSSSASSAQSRIDAANTKIKSLQNQVTGILDSVTSIQTLIAQLEAELAGLKAPSADDFWKKEGRYEDGKPHYVRVFDSAAFNRAMSTYLSKVNALRAKIEARKNDLKQKETELGKKTNELNAAKKELTAACSELQKTMSGSALLETMKRHEEYRERARKAEQEALKAQAQLEKAQEDLKKANEELQKTKDAALELGGYDEKAAEKLDKELADWDPKSQSKPPFQQTGEPTAKQIEAYESAVKAAEKDTKGMLQGAANTLPTKKNGEILPPVEELSARDYVETVPRLASYETGVYAKDAGLLAGFAPDGEKPVSGEMRTQMIEAWTVAGFSPDEIAVAFKKMGLTADPEAQAKKDYEDIKANHSYPADPGHAFADALVEHKNDGAYQVAMIELAKEDTDGLNLMSADGMMSPGGPGIFSRNLADGSYSGNYTDEQRDAFTLAMKAARDAGVYTDAELIKLGSDDSDAQPYAWQELIDRTGGIGQGDVTIIYGTEDSGAGHVLVPSKARIASFSARHPLAALDIGLPDPGKGKKDISNNSVRFSTALGLEETDNHEGSQVNAFRHALWQATIAQRHGVDIAMEIGFAHEENPYALNKVDDPSSVRFATSALADEAVDLLNNPIGRSIGDKTESKSMDDIAAEVLEHYHKEGLWVAKKETDGTYSIHREKLSDEQYEAARDKLDNLDSNGFTPEQAKEWD